MVQCYLCKGKLRVTRDKHVYDEKLKKRYHFKCFAGICRVCDMPVYTKAKHKVIGANVWHEACYKRAHAKRRNPVKTIRDASWKAMVAARKAAGVPKKLWREFEETYFKKHPPEFEEDRQNPIRSLMFSGKEAPAEVFERLEGKKYQLKDGWWMVPDTKHNRLTLQDCGIPFTKHQRPSSRDIIKAYDDLEARTNPPPGHKVLQKEKDWAAKMLVQLGAAKTMDQAHAIIDEYRQKRSKKNPMLVTPEQEMDIVGAFRRVIQGVGTEADRALVRMAREADVIMSTGPSVLLKRNPEEQPVTIVNPVNKKLDYIIQDEFGKVYETGTGSREEAETRALVFNRKYMREFKVIYPKGEPADVKRAAEKATKEMLKS